jgi:phospholipid/cholesterol/gamma-HCH transport system ATP-binding protein
MPERKAAGRRRQRVMDMLHTLPESAQRAIKEVMDKEDQEERERGGGNDRAQSRDQQGQREERRDGSGGQRDGRSQGGQISPDGNYRWDGSAWQYIGDQGQHDQGDQGNWETADAGRH